MSFVAAPGWASERLVQNDGSSGVGTPRAGEVPEGVSAEAWEAISGAIERDRYRAERREDGTVSAANRAQAYTTRFTREGIRVRPQGAGMGAGVEVGLTLAGYGYSQTQPVEAAEPQAKGNRVEFHRGTLTEWYVNRAAGLEQGFTLEEPPLETPQQARTRAGGREPLRLELAVAGPVRVERTEDGEAVLLRDPEGRVRLRYGGLRAWDATGRELASRLEAGGGRIALLVEDAAARYPLTIDPTILNEAAKLTAGDAAAFDNFGQSVSISGDTLVAGALHDECTPSGIDCGAAYVFEKPAGGWAGTLTQDAKLTASDAAAGDFFSRSVSISGGTVVVGAWTHDCTPSGNDCGAAYVFEKPALGWADGTQDAKLTASDAAASDFFGRSVSISGGTVVVGAWSDDCTPSGLNCGSAYVFEKPALGWADGTQDAKLTASDAAANDRFGSSVAISGNTVAVGPVGTIARPQATIAARPTCFWGLSSHRRRPSMCCRIAGPRTSPSTPIRNWSSTPLPPLIPSISSGSTRSWRPAAPTSPVSGFSSASPASRFPGRSCKCFTISTSVS